MNNAFSTNKQHSRGSAVGFRALALGAIAALICAPSGGAYCESPQQHPFYPETILYYEIDDSILRDGIFLGGGAAIDQTRNEDCSMEAALSAIARFPAGARLISDMITRGPGGGYRVTFEDDPTQTFSVNQSDLSKYHIKDTAKWAAVIEAAALKRFPALVNGGRPEVRLRRREGEPLCALGLTVMTGHQAEYVSVADTYVETLAEFMYRSMRMNTPMTAASKSPNNLPRPIIVPDHCYTVLSYNPWTRIVTLRNPWGHNTSKKYPQMPAPGESKDGIQDLGGGVIQMRIGEFSRYFRFLAHSRLFHL